MAINHFKLGNSDGEEDLNSDHMIYKPSLLQKYLTLVFNIMHSHGINPWPPPPHTHTHRDTHTHLNAKRMQISVSVLITFAPSHLVACYVKLYYWGKIRYYVNVDYARKHDVINNDSKNQLLISPLTHLPWTKWLPFHRRFFHMHFGDWKVLYFD